MTVSDETNTLLNSDSSAGKNSLASSWKELFKSENRTTISVYMAVVLVFITHGMVNAALLSSWNDAFFVSRCFYWNLWGCSLDQSWMLNWISFGQFHIYILLACLAYAAMGNALLEQRLAHLVGLIVTSNLFNGIFLLDFLNESLALLQCVLFLGLLGTLAIHTSLATTTTTASMATTTTTTSTTTETVAPPRKQDCVESTTKRPTRMTLTSFVMGLLCLLSSFQVVEMTFSTGGKENNYYYRGDISDPALFQVMSKASVANLLWITLILAWSAILGTQRQQKSVFLGHALALLVAQCFLLSGWQGQQWNPDQAMSACVGNFFTILVALMGVY